MEGIAEQASRYEREVCRFKSYHDHHILMIEIEKKYKIGNKRFKEIKKSLTAIAIAIDFFYEENTLYTSDFIKPDTVFRLRNFKPDGHKRDCILTYKEKGKEVDGIKFKEELETTVSNPKNFLEILTRLGCKPSLVYEKRREVWQYKNSEICLDKLPFGNFIEVEGAVEEILEVETLLNLKSKVEHLSYPALTRKLGQKVDGRFEALFTK